MKNYLFILLLGVVVISCTDSNEDKIAAAFQEYAASHFDDPSTLEIVSIEIKDTFDIENMVEQLSLVNDSLKKESKKLSDEMSELSRKYGHRTQQVPNVQHLFNEVGEAALRIMDHAEDNLISMLAQSQNSESENIDTLNTKAIKAIVKYRVKRNGDKKLESITTYNSLNLDKVLYTCEEDAPTYIKFLFSQVDYYTSTIALQSDVIKKYENFNNAIKDYFNK